MKLPRPVDLPIHGTPSERLDMAFRKTLTVTKHELIKQEKQNKIDREKKRQLKPAH